MTKKIDGTLRNEKFSFSRTKGKAEIFSLFYITCFALWRFSLPHYPNGFRIFWQLSSLLLFLEQALEVATNRGHSRISGADIQHAEEGYSEGALLWLGYEIEDTNPDAANAIYAFYGSKSLMEIEDVRDDLALRIGQMSRVEVGSGGGTIGSGSTGWTKIGI